MDFKRTTKSALGRVLRVSGVHRHTLASTMNIAAFHRVNDDLPPDSVTCSSEDFEEFCRYFKENFRVVPLAEQVAGCHAHRSMGGTMSITLDDGYLDNYTVAAPILERLGLHATFFVVTQFIGSDAIAPWDSHLSRQPGWMSWGQIRDLVSRGFHIGGHTATHIDMGKESAERIDSELRSSKRKLHQELERDIQLFAYPFGGQENITETARNLVKEVGFNCCLSCYSGSNPAVADPFHLQRLPISSWYVTPDQMTAELVLQRFHGLAPALVSCQPALIVASA